MESDKGGVGNGEMRGSVFAFRLVWFCVGRKMSLRCSLIACRGEDSKKMSPRWGWMLQDLLWYRLRGSFRLGWVGMWICCGTN